ncbi:MAG: CopD family protein [Pseudomonadota bacterium]
MNTYDLARGLHIIAVLAFVAGMLMLPRFYAYQCESQPGGELEKKMIEAAAKLRAIIMTPSVIAIWVLGLWLLFSFDRGKWGEPWLWAKLALALAVTGLYGFFGAQGKKLAKGERRYSGKFWRMISEVPFIIAVVIVLLATIEPR